MNTLNPLKILEILKKIIEILNLITMIIRDSEGIIRAIGDLL
jgi:hypothetical protein